MHAIGYTRVSTEAQSKHGVSLEAQAQAISDYAAANGLKLDAVFSDPATSGKTPISERPGLMDALNALKRGSVLLVAKRDRIGRDALVMAMSEHEAERKGARILSLAGEGTESDDPASVLMRRIKDAFSEHERLMIAARTRAAMQTLKAKGRYTGGRTPLGFVLSEDGRHLRPHEGEQRAIRIVQALEARGMSRRAIARELQQRGILTRRGAQWTHKQVGAVIAQEVA